ncbi:MAG: hypothetical protein WCT85_01575 [Parachlamydiales bacterium]|jgi:hypothetical protein
MTTTKINFTSFHDANFYCQGNTTTTLHFKSARYAQWNVKGAKDKQFLVVVEDSKESKSYKIFIGATEKKLQADSSYKFMVTKSGDPRQVAELKKYCGIAEDCFSSNFESKTALKNVAKKDVLPVIQDYLKTSDELELDETEVTSPAKAAVTEVTKESSEKITEVAAKSTEKVAEATTVALSGLEISEEILQSLNDEQVSEEEEIPMPSGFFTTWVDALSQGWETLTQGVASFLSSINPFKPATVEEDKKDVVNQ